jgi:hypothetical protein
MNAALNATSAALLVLGWFMIRDGDAHRRAIPAAFVCPRFVSYSRIAQVEASLPRHRRSGRSTRSSRTRLRPPRSRSP